MKNTLASILLTVPYDPSEVLLIGRNIDTREDATNAEIKIDVGGDESSQLTVAVSGTGDDHEIALIQSYLFEGNCYDLPKPKIMVVAGAGTDIPEGAVPADSKLKYWRMHKSDKSTEVTVEDGTLEALVLEANMPGSRAKGSYAANMQMAHKSGRLTS